MSMMEFEDIQKIKPSVRVDIKKALEIYTEILKTGIINKPVVVDEKSGVVLDGHELFQALDLLSPKRIPVLKVDLSQIKVELLDPNLGLVRGHNKSRIGKS